MLVTPKPARRRRREEEGHELLIALKTQSGPTPITPYAAQTVPLTFLIISACRKVPLPPAFSERFRGDNHEEFGAGPRRSYERTCIVGRSRSAQKIKETLPSNVYAIRLDLYRRRPFFFAVFFAAFFLAGFFFAAFLAGFFAAFFLAAFFT